MAILRFVRMLCDCFKSRHQLETEILVPEVNLPLLTYHPAVGEVDFLWKPERRGPAMYWYGWMLTSLIGAVALAWIAGIVPEQWVQRAIFFGSLSVVGYLIFYTVATTSWRRRQRC